MNATTGGSPAATGWLQEAVSYGIRTLVLGGIVWLVNITQQTRENVVDLQARLQRLDRIEAEFARIDARLDEAYSDRATWLTAATVLKERVDANAKLLDELRVEVQQLARRSRHGGEP